MSWACMAASENEPLLFTGEVTADRSTRMNCGSMQGYTLLQKYINLSLGTQMGDCIQMAAIL